MSGRPVAKQLIPPVLYDVARRARRARRGDKPVWEYAPEGWLREEHGWEVDDDVAERYRAKLPKFRAAIAAPNPIGVPTSPARDVVATAGDQNVILELAYALALAGMSRPRTRVLDYGGGAGFLSFVAEELFPALDVEFHVKELPAISSVGRELAPKVTFWDDDACLEEAFDVVLVSNALQYIEEYEALLAQLAKAASGGLLLLQHVPTAVEGSTFVVSQNAYGRAFTSWVFGRDDIVAGARRGGLDLRRELLGTIEAEAEGAPSPWVARGFLFESRA